MREQDLRDKQEVAVAEMMKHTLEQLEVSHKQIVHERDMIRANLERQIRDCKNQLIWAREEERERGGNEQAKLIESMAAHAHSESEIQRLRLIMQVCLCVYVLTCVWAYVCRCVL